MLVLKLILTSNHFSMQFCSSCSLGKFLKSTLIPLILSSNALIGQVIDIKSGPPHIDVRETPSERIFDINGYPVALIEKPMTGKETESFVRVYSPDLTGFKDHTLRREGYQEGLIDELDGYIASVYLGGDPEGRGMQVVTVLSNMDIEQQAAYAQTIEATVEGTVVYSRLVSSGNKKFLATYANTGPAMNMTMFKANKLDLNHVVGVWTTNGEEPRLAKWRLPYKRTQMRSSASGMGDNGTFRIATPIRNGGAKESVLSIVSLEPSSEEPQIVEIPFEKVVDDLKWIQHPDGNLRLYGTFRKKIDMDLRNQFFVAKAPFSKADFKIFDFHKNYTQRDTEGPSDTDGKLRGFYFPSVRHYSYDSRGTLTIAFLTNYVGSGVAFRKMYIFSIDKNDKLISTKVYPDLMQQIVSHYRTTAGGYAFLTAGESPIAIMNSKGEGEMPTSMKVAGNAFTSDDYRAVIVDPVTNMRSNVPHVISGFECLDIGTMQLSQVENKPAYYTWSYSNEFVRKHKDDKRTYRLVKIAIE